MYNTHYRVHDLPTAFDAFTGHMCKLSRKECHQDFFHKQQTLIWASRTHVAYIKQTIGRHITTGFVYIIQQLKHLCAPLTQVVIPSKIKKKDTPA